MESGSDERTKRQMQAVKDCGLDFYELIDEVASEGDGMTRELSLAKTKIEEAVMWAVKHITG